MTLNDKIKGAVYGMALGDALGLGTEFMTKDEILYHYPGGLKNFDYFVRDVHRANYKPGEWTNDTEITLLILESIVDSDGIRIPDISHRLKKWFDSDPNDPTLPFRMVIPEPDWEDNPIVVCHSVWRDREITDASNEALNRALPAAVASPDYNSLYSNTSRLVNMTHDPAGCVATTNIISAILRSLIYDKEEIPYESLIEIGRNIDERIIRYLKIARDGNLDMLDLDDEDTFWSTNKTMAAALWVYWHIDSPEEALLKIVNEGGDADTNASLAMMLFGLKQGYDKLPDIKHDIINKERLDRVADKLTLFIENQRK